MSVITVVTTVATHEDALRLAHALVESGRVACAQMHAIESVYRWEGALQHETEWRLLLKTTAGQQTAVMAELAALHPYTLPAITVFTAAQASAAFEAWVADSTRTATPARVAPPAPGDWP